MGCAYAVVRVRVSRLPTPRYRRPAKRNREARPCASAVADRSRAGRASGASGQRPGCWVEEPAVRSPRCRRSSRCIVAMLRTPPATPSSRLNQFAPDTISPWAQTSIASCDRILALFAAVPSALRATAAASIAAISGGFGNWKIGKRRGIRGGSIGSGRADLIVVAEVAHELIVNRVVVAEWPGGHPGGRFLERLHRLVVFQR
jgi:hypothetical protein